MFHIIDSVDTEPISFFVAAQAMTQLKSQLQRHIINTESLATLRNEMPFFHIHFEAKELHTHEEEWIVFGIIQVKVFRSNRNLSKTKIKFHQGPHAASFFQSENEHPLILGNELFDYLVRPGLESRL